jgi:hypothetical protein
MNFDILSIKFSILPVSPTSNPVIIITLKFEHGNRAILHLIKVGFQFFGGIHVLSEQLMNIAVSV